MQNQDMSMNAPDPMDFASMLTDERNESAVRNRVRPPDRVPENVVLTEEDLECQKCFELMPEIRRRNGYRICVPCQERIDAKDKFIAR